MSELWPAAILGLLALAALYLRLFSRVARLRPMLSILVLLGLVLLLIPGFLSEDDLAEKSLVLVVDASYSMGARFEDACDWSAFRLGRDRPVLVLAAGSRPLPLFRGRTRDLPTTWPRPREYDEQSFRAQSDLGLCLDYAQEQLEGDPFELALVTDGGTRNWNLGSARVVNADVLTGPLRRADDLGLHFVDAPPTLVEGQRSSLRLHLRGHLNDSRSLQVEVLGQSRIAMDLRAGAIDEVLVFELGAPFPSSGTFEARLVLDARDADPANDRCSIPFRVLAPSTIRLKLIEGPAGSSDLAEWLRSFPGLDVLPESAALSKADLIVVNDCSLRDLPIPEAEIRKRVLAGAGLFLSGVEESFGAGGWENSLIDELSPLHARPGKKARLLRFALDRSGSMSRDQRLLAARASLRALFKNLGPLDRLELILFAADQTSTFYSRQDPSASEALDRDLSRVSASGGTDLRGLLEALAQRPAGTEKEDVLVILATDGRDPQGLDAKFCTDIREGIEAAGLSFQIFWFDRDESLRPDLLTLVGEPQRLHAIDDFSRMLEPFFRSLGDELRLEDVDLKRGDSEVVHLSRLLRSRRDAGAEILVSSTEDLNGLARVERGLGRVAAAPTDLVAGYEAGLFDSKDAERSSAFRNFLASLAEKKSAAQVRRQLSAGTERLEVTMSEMKLSGSQLLGEDGRILKLEASRPGLALSEARLIVDRAESFRLSDSAGRSLGLVLLAALPALDRSPSGDPGEIESWLAEHRSESRSSSSLPPLLPILLLVLLAIDLMLRSRGQ